MSTDQVQDQNSYPPYDQSGQPIDAGGGQFQQPYQANGYSAYSPSQQDPQPVNGSSSPEAPARSEQESEVIQIPEVGAEATKKVEKASEKQKESVKIKEKDSVDRSGEASPDQTKFESPFRVYGYQASQDVTRLGRKASGSKVSGDTSFAKNWLLVLLGRLLRVEQR